MKTICWILWCGMLAANASLGATFSVLNNLNAGAGSLRQVIANALPGDTIIFHPSLSGQTITLASEIEIFPPSSSLEELMIDASALPNGISISGNNACRIFNVTPAVNLILKNLTLTGGNCTGDTEPFGGAILNSGVLSLRNCTISGNTGVSGGGVFNDGSLNVEQSTLSGNSATTGNGGGIANVGSLYVTAQSVISGNSAPSGFGGGIFNPYIPFTLTVDQSTLSGNSAISGGGIFNEGTVAVSQSTLSANSASAGDGGGILNFGTLTVNQSTLSGNSAASGSGGGIFNEGLLTSNQSTLSGNSAPSGNGGGIYNTDIQGGDATLTVNQSTLSKNSASSGGGIFSDFSGTGNGTTTLSRTIIAGNSATVINQNINVYFSAGGNLPGSTPILAPLGNYGGPTQTMPPLPGSPAIDPVGGPTSSTFTTDQRGFARTLDGDGNGSAIVDFGAVEARRIIVTTAADELDTPAGTQTSLREAIRDKTTEDIIIFAPSLSGQVITLTSEIVIAAPADVTIDASALPGGITISGNNTSRIFTVSGGQTVEFKGLTLTGGNGTGAVASGSGGAIYNSGTLTLSRCTLSGNSAAAFGGAVFNLDGNTLVLTQCTLSGNSAGYGGALYNRGALLLTQCTLSGNSAPGEGGAIVNWVGTLTLSNSIVAGSLAPSPEDILNGFLATLTRVGANLVQSFTDNGTSNGSGTVSNVAPLLTPLGHYGGPTQTMHPLSGSPAILSGSETRTDQRGFTLTGPPTIGAVMLGPVVTVTDEATLRSELTNSANTRGRVIRFASSLEGQTLTLTGGQLLVPSNSDGLFIDGSSLVAGLTIDANGAVTNHRIMEIKPNSTVALHGLTLTGGNATGGFPDDSGGGIYADGSGPGNSVSLTLSSCTLSGNSAAWVGGGILSYGASGSAKLSLTSCTLTGNSATYGAGTFSDGTFTGGRATQSLNSCTISGNSATYGAGLYNNGYQGSAAMSLTSCTLSNNSATLGGGIFSDGNEGSATLRLISCTLSSNFATQGAGIFNSVVTGSSALSLTSSTLSGNSATVEGGGIYSRSLNNGIVMLNLNNTILAVNTAPIGPDLWESPSGATITAMGTNLMSSTAGSNLGATPPNIIITAPLLAPLGNYGGSTQTMALLPGSPARNTAIGSTITNDQRGFPIVGTPDIGAYEAGTTNTYALWAIEHIGSAAAFITDQENDGNQNGLEYATRTDPLAANANPFGHPALIAGPAYQFAFPYRPGATDLRYIVYRSPDLTNWTEIYRYDLTTHVLSESGAVTGDENSTTQIITITDPDFLTPKCFWKLVVENP